MKNSKHIWPTRHAHINVYGRYHFNRDNVGKKQQLRELRQPVFSLNDQNFSVAKTKPASKNAIR
jgi:hypothetical protein